MQTVHDNTFEQNPPRTQRYRTDADNAANAHDVSASAAYLRKVGERLRVVRLQSGLSLQHLEVISADEFRTGAVAAYERGDRAISVPRLARLASFYGVSVGQLLPSNNDVVAGTTADTATGQRITIDVVKLSKLRGLAFHTLARFIRMIQFERQDFTHDVVTLGDHDTLALAAMLEVPVSEVRQHLDALELLYLPNDARPRIERRPNTTCTSTLVMSPTRGSSQSFVEI